MKIMKKFLLILFTIHFSLFTALSQTVLSPYQPGVTSEGAVYFLPKTAISVTLLVEKTSYQVTDAKKPSPLSADLEQGKAWVLDPKKWFEVFVPKPYDYLAIVMQGKMPWYDRGIGKWVSKEEKDEQQQAEVERANEEIRRAEEVSAQALAPQTVQKQMEEDPVGVFSNSPEDDLPF